MLAIWPSTTASTEGKVYLGYTSQRKGHLHPHNPLPNRCVPAGFDSILFFNPQIPQLREGHTAATECSFQICGLPDPDSTGTICYHLPDSYPPAREVLEVEILNLQWAVATLQESNITIPNPLSPSDHPSEPSSYIAYSCSSDISFSSVSSWQDKAAGCPFSTQQCKHTASPAPKPQQYESHGRIYLSCPGKLNQLLSLAQELFSDSNTSALPAADLDQDPWRTSTAQHPKVDPVGTVAADTSRSPAAAADEAADSNKDLSQAPQVLLPPPSAAAAVDEAADHAGLDGDPNSNTSPPAEAAGATASNEPALHPPILVPTEVPSAPLLQVLEPYELLDQADLLRSLFTPYDVLGTREPMHEAQQQQQEKQYQQTQQQPQQQEPHMEHNNQKEQQEESWAQQQQQQQQQQQEEEQLSSRDLSAAADMHVPSPVILYLIPLVLEAVEDPTADATAAATIIDGEQQLLTIAADDLRQHAKKQQQQQGVAHAQQCEQQLIRQDGCKERGSSWQAWLGRVGLCAWLLILQVLAGHVSGVLSNCSHMYPAK